MSGLELWCVELNLSLIPLSTPFSPLQGGIAFVAIKGAFKVYFKQQQYLRQAHRKILNFPEQEEAWGGGEGGLRRWRWRRDELLSEEPVLLKQTQNQCGSLYLLLTTSLPVLEWFMSPLLTSTATTRRFQPVTLLWRWMRRQIQTGAC